MTRAVREATLPPVRLFNPRPEEYSRRHGQRSRQGPAFECRTFASGRKTGTAFQHGALGHARCLEATIAVADPIRPRFSRHRLVPATCAVERHHDTAHVVPGGEIDIVSAATVDDRIAQMRDAGFGRLLLDLRQVTFLDVCGLRVVLRWADAARADRGATFAVIPGPPHVQRIFTLTGTAERVEFVGPG